VRDGCVLNDLLYDHVWQQTACLHRPGPAQGVTFACVNAAKPADAGAADKADPPRPAEAGDEARDAPKEPGAAKAGGEEGKEPKSVAADEPKLATFAFRVKERARLDEFIEAVEAHKAGGDKASAEVAARRRRCSLSMTGLGWVSAVSMRSRPCEARKCLSESASRLERQGCDLRCACGVPACRVRQAGADRGAGTVVQV